MIKISFIIPVFNLHSYLHRCLRSVIGQEIEKEILLIDDASTDDSLSICNQYQKEYPFIKVFENNGKGVSSARNLGLRYAEGEYICFLDGDDFYLGNHIKDFYMICHKENLDVFRGKYCIYNEENYRFDHTNLKKNSSYYNTTISSYLFLKYSIKENDNEVVPWLGLFRRQFLFEHNIFFPEGISYEEDHLFFLKVLLTDCRIMQSNVEFYAYTNRLGSASKTPSLKNALDVINVVKQELNLIYNLSFEYLSVCEDAKKYTSASFYQLTSIYGRVNRQNRKIIKEHANDKSIKRMCIKYAANKHQKLKIIMFFYFSWIVDLVYFIKRRCNVI